MFDKFCDYMYYLLTSPFKCVKKKMNQWYILFKVLGRRFDDGMESLYDAREQTMLATCDPVMLPVHADDRKMSQYPGEDSENFRARIANYPEVLRLGGSDPGVLLAVRTLGYETPALVKANEFKGRVYYQTDGSWNLDGSRLMEAGELPDRWAEFYIVIKMSVDDSHPISTAILKKEVRKTKQVGAKDNYSFQYHLSIQEPHSTGSRADFKWKLFYWNYRMLDGSWRLDGSCDLDSDRSTYPVSIGFRYKGFEVFPHEASKLNERFEIHIREPDEYINNKATYKIPIFFFEYRKTDGSWETDGSVLINSDRTNYKIKDAYRAAVTHTEEIRQARWHKQHNLFYLDGSWNMDGSKILDAWEQEFIIGYDLHYLDGSWLQDGSIILDGIENQEVM